MASRFRGAGSTKLEMYPIVSLDSFPDFLSDGYWKDGVFTRFTEVDLKALEQAFAVRVLLTRKIN